MSTIIDNIIILIILIPFVYIICSYINIRSEFSKISEELYKKLELLLSSINHNIKELSKYGIDERLKHIAKEMTDNIGFKFIDNKLEENSMYLYSDEEDDYSRFPYNYKEDRKNNGLQLISKHVEEINELVQLSTKRNNLFTCNMYFISLRREKEVVNFMLDKNYIHNSEYFKKYHNQIYKKIYTNARVVKKECLNLLEKHKKLSEIWLNVFYTYDFFRNTIKNSSTEKCII